MGSKFQFMKEWLHCFQPVARQSTVLGEGRVAQESYSLHGQMQEREQETCVTILLKDMILDFPLGTAF